MNINKKINKFLAISLALTNLAFQCDKSSIYAMKPNSLNCIRRNEISAIKREFSSDDRSESISYINSDVELDGNKVTFMVFNGPVLMRGLADNQFNENLVLEGNTIKEKITYALTKNFNILHILAKINADSASNFRIAKKTGDSPNDISEIFKNMNQKLQESDLYKKYYKELEDLLGFKIPTSTIPKAIEILMLFDFSGLDPKTESEIAQSLCLGFGIASGLLAAVCLPAWVVALPVILFASYRGTEALYDSEEKIQEIIDEERKANIVILIRQFLGSLRTNPKEALNSNVCCMYFDDRKDINTLANDDGFFRYLGKMITSSAKTYEQHPNKGANVDFSFVEGLGRCASKMIEYDVFPKYIQIFRKLHSGQLKSKDLKAINSALGENCSFPIILIFSSKTFDTIRKLLKCDVGEDIIIDTVKAIDDSVTEDQIREAIYEVRKNNK